MGLKNKLAFLFLVSILMLFLHLSYAQAHHRQHLSVISSYDKSHPWSNGLIKESLNKYISHDRMVLSSAAAATEETSERNIINKSSFSFYQIYKQVIWTTSGIIILLVFCILILVSNIEKRKKIALALEESEEKLTESELFLNKVIENSPHPMWVSDNKGTLIRSNQALRDLLDVTDDDIVGKYNVLKDNIVEEQGFLPLVNDVFEKGNIAQFNIEWDGSKLTQIALKNKTFVILDITISPIIDSAGKVVNAICQHKDITDLVLSRKKIEASLKEKEILIKEIHHRVKNNMQVISSILLLQSNTIEDKNTADVLKQCQNRIQSMALVHEKLYKTEDLVSINPRQYIKTLMKSLHKTYTTEKDNIVTRVDAEGRMLDIDTAVPLGLIVNELVTNAFQHAFEDGEGKINVALRDIDEKRLELTVRDNGVGLPEDFDINSSKTLGLQLVSLLSIQLKGDLKVTGNQGTEFQITFKRGKVKKI